MVTLFCIIFGYFAQVGTSGPIDLQVSISMNEKRNQGALYYALYASQGEYDADHPIRSGKIAVDSDPMLIHFRSLPAGDHVFKVFHDLNGNGELDTGLFGFPKEPFGFSNDALGRFGPPSWEQAKFPADQHQHSIQLRLR